MARFARSVLLLSLLLASTTPQVGAVEPVPSTPVLVDDDEGEMVPGQVIVKFDSAASAPGVVSAERLGVVKTLNNTRVQLLSTTPGQELATIQRLRRHGSVVYAEPNHRVRASLVPTDAEYASQWDMTKIGMPAAWDITTGDSSVLVAVLDTGVDCSHPDLDSRCQSTGAKFLASPDASCPAATIGDDDAYQIPDGFTHGTHVAGTIAAESNLTGAGTAGVAGIAPGAKILPVKILDCTGAGTEADIILGVDYARTSGADIINMSLGAIGKTCATGVQDAIDTAFAAGILLVAAAGNDGGTKTSFPAGCNNVISVGATTDTDALASFSQKNKTVDLTAPGTAIISTCRAAGTIADECAGTQGDRTYAAAQGTSMATPHVAGCAALVKSADLTLTPTQIESILKSSAIDWGKDMYDTSFGYGTLDCGVAVQMAVSTTKSVWGWGNNASGLLANGTKTTTVNPERVRRLTGFTKIVAGSSHSLGLKSDGTVWAWGSNNSGQLGDGSGATRTTPVQVPGLTGVTQISAGDSHSLALKGDGTVWAWGANKSGQLGDNTTTNRLSPVQVKDPTGTDVMSANDIAAGGSHSLAAVGSTVFSWGSNKSGQLGITGATTKDTKLLPTFVKLFAASVSGISGGTSHSVVVLSSGAMWAWGSNSKGQLGDGSTTTRMTPVASTAITSGATAVQAGGTHTLALKGGTVWAWGDNSKGQLGTGDTSKLHSSPADLTIAATAISGGKAFSLALKSDGTVIGFGENTKSQLGDPDLKLSRDPIAIPDLTGVTAIAAGGSHSLAIAPQP